MWKTALQILLVMFLRNRFGHAKAESSHHFSAVKENIALIAERRAAIFKLNFSNDVERVVNSFIGYLFVLLASVCAGLTAIMWLFAIAWSSPHRDTYLGVMMLFPILLATGTFIYIRQSWKKEPLFQKSIQQIETDWVVFRDGLDGTADISDEANR